MYAYNDVLPYGDQMHVNINNEDYLIFDQFCLLPKCSCSDTILDIVSTNPHALAGTTNYERVMRCEI